MPEEKSKTRSKFSPFSYFTQILQLKLILPPGGPQQHRSNYYYLLCVTRIITTLKTKHFDMQDKTYAIYQDMMPVCLQSSTHVRFLNAQKKKKP